MPFCFLVMQLWMACGFRGSGYLTLSYWLVFTSSLSGLCMHLSQYGGLTQFLTCLHHMLLYGRSLCPKFLIFLKALNNTTELSLKHAMCWVIILSLLFIFMHANYIFLESQHFLKFIKSDWLLLQITILSLTMHSFEKRKY